MYNQWSMCVVTLIFYKIGVYSETVQLTPSEVRVIENSTITLTLSKANGNVVETIWTNSQISERANLVVLNNKCVTTRFLKESDLFTGVCNANGTYSVIIKKIDRKQHGAEWMCSDILSQSNKVVILVSVPATSVTLNRQNTGYMRENLSEKVACFSSACRPDPRIQWYLRSDVTNVLYNLTHSSKYTYIYKEYGLKVVESILEFKPNRTYHGFRVYCEVWTRSIAADIKSREIIVNVTYPPDDFPKIHEYEINSALRVIESDTGTFVCSVIGGNPRATLSWNCFGSNDITFKTEGDTVSSTIKWTAHRYYSSCSCVAHHLNNWKRITNITVNVQFPTEIRTFSLSSSSSEQTVVINESDEATLVCIAEANPSSNLSIENPTGDYISKVSNSNIARHTLRNASYVNAGEYSCSGRNNYTIGPPASLQLILIVKCPPRPYSGDTSVMKVATVLNADVTLNFSAWKYLDKPNKTVFGWFKEREHISDDGIKYIIRSEELQTNITVKNITEQDFGLYRVSVRNSVGEYVHYYELNTAGKPDPPKDFNIIDNSITDTTVTLTWSPSFNGGIQQIFVLIYRTSTESVWLNKSIIDNGKKIMHYALYGLSSMQEYEIEMFAKNRVGNSAHTKRLQLKTKASIHRLKDILCPSNTGTFFGVGAGTFFSTFVMVMFLLFGYKQLKKRNLSRSRSHQQGDMKEHQVPVTDKSNVSSAYTDLDGNQKEMNVYDVVNEQNLGTTSSQQDLATQGTSAYIEMTDARIKESLDYINIKI